MHLFRRVPSGNSISLLFVAVISVCVLSDASAVASEQLPLFDIIPAAKPPVPTLDKAVMWRSVEEMEMGASAMIQAKASAKSAESTRQELLSQQAFEVVSDTYSKVSDLVPTARAQASKVRKYAFLAAQTRDHVLQVENAYRHIEEDAAGAARKAVIGWISADAAKTAENSVRTDDGADRIAAAVAAAAEPYHLALLRNQKFCEETYSKAKTALSSSQKLQTDAKTIALHAQVLQASGLGVEGQSSFAAASNMMSEAETLRQWASKLYNQANTACSTAGGYTLAEQQAAANAAMTTVINPPMKLPKKL